MHAASLESIFATMLTCLIFNFYVWASSPRGCVWLLVNSTEPRRIIFSQTQICLAQVAVLMFRENTLHIIHTPTPRWPDLLCVYNPSSRLLFTSKLFSAHVAPTAVGSSRQNPFDIGGWEQYEPDWHFFYDCMLAPVARQASGSLWHPLGLQNM